MQRYILRRVLLTLPVIWVVTLVLFILLRLTPGDPVRNQFGLEATPEQLETTRRDLGLDRPIVVQYFDWLWHLAQGDFGRSIRSGRPVSEEIWSRLPATLELQVLAFGLAVLVAVPLGTFAALKHNTPFATVTSGVVLASIAVPSFFFATLLVHFLTYKFRVFETPRYVPIADDPVSNLTNLVLPVIALSYASMAVFTRFVRSSVLEVLGQDYVRTARAKGLTEQRVIFHHALRNALIPLITLLGITIGGLWVGTFIIERIFNWPGVGRLATTALLNQDYPMVQAVVLISTLTYILANLLVDIAYAFADPRIRDERGG